MQDGSIAGGFYIEHHLATGGFSEVYSAFRRDENRRVALKVLHASLADNRDANLRLMREADAAWSIVHPNIVRIYDVGILPDERPYLSMELLDGSSLDKLLDRELRLSVADTLAILEPLCAALAALHERGIVHRDLKPSNVFLDQGREGPRVVLLDFGIAKFLGTHSVGLTSSGHVLGTPGRMAPEQLLGRPVDARTDVYALGALAFQMLSGHKPFGGHARDALKQLHLHAKRPRVSEHCNVSPSLDPVIIRAMAIDPVHRYADPHAFLEAFRAHARSAPERTPSVDDVVCGESIGLLVWLRIPGQSLDDPDEALLDDIDGIADMVARELRGRGFSPALESGTKSLYVRALDPAGAPTGGRDGRAAACERALDDARAVYQCARARPDPDPRIAVSLRLHVGAAQASEGEEGGDIFDVGAWAAAAPSEGVTMTLAFTSVLSARAE